MREEQHQWMEVVRVGGGKSERGRKRATTAPHKRGCSYSLQGVCNDT